MRIHWRLSKSKQKLSLLHLPNELLLQVIDELGERDIYNLSVQCKRLQRLSLTPYLRRLGVTTPLIFPINQLTLSLDVASPLRSPIDHLVIPWAQFSAPGFPLAFSAKTVSKITCNIDPIWHSSHDTLAIQRLCGMITDIMDLENLALYFARWDSCRGTDQQSKAEAFIQLLKTVAKRCVCLTLSHTSGHECYEHEWVGYAAMIEMAATQQWASRSLVKSLFKALRRRSSFAMSRLRSPHAPETFYPNCSYTLKTLIFESNEFLYSPYSSWARKILNTAPLTRLDFVDVKLSYKLAALIFGALTIPTLKHLRIIVCKFQFKALAEFLSRHNSISTFDIISPVRSTIDGLFPEISSLPITTLPALVSLTSNTIGVSLLLTPIGAFPKLTNVRVVVQLSPHDHFIRDAMADYSLAGASTRLSDSNIRFCLDVLPSYPNTSAQVVAFMNNLRNYPVLSYVREIVFGFPRPDALPTTAVPTWLSLFPLLEHVKFLDTPMGLDHKTHMFPRITERCFWKSDVAYNSVNPWRYAVRCADSSPRT